MGIKSKRAELQAGRRERQQPPRGRTQGKGARRRPLWRCQRPHSATQRASARHEACTPSHGHELGTGPLGSSCRPRLQRSCRNGICGRHVQGRGPGEVMSQRRGHVPRNVPSGDFIGVRTSQRSHARRAGWPAPQAVWWAYPSQAAACGTFRTDTAGGCDTARHIRAWKSCGDRGQHRQRALLTPALPQAR